MNQYNYPIAYPITIDQALSDAYAHWNAGQAVQAEQLCLNVLQVLPNQPVALHLLGLIAHAYGKLELAIDYLRKACAFPEVPAPYWSNLAEMCRQKGLLAEAEQSARNALTRDPQLIAAWNNLGIILQESGKFEASLECLQRVIALQPDNHEAYNNLGNTCKRLGQLDQAQTFYQQALALRPDYAEVLSNLAVLWTDLGRFDEAVAAAQQALEIDPQLIDVYCNLAQIEIMHLRYADAQRWVDALLSFAPHHPGALTARAQLLIKAGHFQEALVFARQVLSAAPENATANNLLGQALQMLGQHNEAAEYFERAAALPGTVAEEAMVSLAVLLMETGKKEAAIDTFEQALERFPGSTRVMTARCDSKRYHSNDPDIAAMEAALAHAVQPPLNEQLNLHFALGKAYLDIDNSERAFFISTGVMPSNAASSVMTLPRLVNG